MSITALTQHIQVLLIEDDAGDARLVLELLRDGPLRTRVSHVKSLTEARKWLIENECDVVLADLSLSDSHGFATIRAIHDTAPALPVVVLSGHDDLAFALDAVQAGTQDFLVKGQVDGPQLQRSMLYAIQRKQLETELRKARQEAETANATKSRCLATMSHELRTPLNAIIGFAQLLMLTEPKPGEQEQLNIICQAGSTLMALINDILDLSKIEAGKVRVRLSDFDLADALHTTVDLFRGQAQRKKLDLGISLSPELPQRLRGDAGLLRQVLTNLIGNALKFTNEGGIDVAVEPGGPRRDDGKVMVIFHVTDTGIGIQPENKSRIFEMFEQEDNSLTRRFSGSGLGLAISKALVTLLGGHIGVESAHGVGSRFSFSILFDAADLELEREPPPSQPTLPAALAGSSRRRRLLLVEDDRFSQKLVTAAMETQGYEIAIANDGAHGLALLQEQDFDLILMDIQLPVLDGLSATRLIRSGAVPGCDRSIPIVALSAFAMRDDRERFLQAGMTDYLSKPIDINRMLQTIHRVLENSNTREKQAR